MTRLLSPGRSLPLSWLVCLSGLGITVLWLYWPTLIQVAERWAHDPRYSHGYLVPVFALVLLWLRRQHLAGPPLPTWWGLPLLVAGAAMRLAGAYYYFEWLGLFSLLPTLAGLFLLLGGWPALRWSWPAIGFLLFMMPLPYRVEVALAQPLQGVATAASTYALQSLGLPAWAQGNVIILNDVRIGVVEACSGLSMLVIFFALSTAFALLTQQPLWQKVVLVLSAVPIALFANVVRIMATGILHETAGRAAAEFVFHDLAGWLMMLLALGLLWMELWVLPRLFLEPDTHPIPVTFRVSD